MKTITKMINQAGGLNALRDKPIIIPASDCWMRLAVEVVGIGPNGLPIISVAHYYEQNGDLICDPDMTFEVLTDATGLVQPDWHPVSIQHATGMFTEATFKDESGRVMVRPAVIRDLRSFARLWDRNIREQGYPERFRACRDKASEE